VCCVLISSIMKMDLCLFERQRLFSNETLQCPPLQELESWREWCRLSVHGHDASILPGMSSVNPRLKLAVRETSVQLKESEALCKTLPSANSVTSQIAGACEFEVATPEERQSLTGSVGVTKIPVVQNSLPCSCFAP
jgi:hypothetical protein